MDCGICLMTEQHEESIRLSCSHGFHSACIAQWFSKKKTCPYCRMYFKLLDMLRIFVFRKEIVLNPSGDELFSYLLNNNIDVLASETSTYLKTFKNFFDSLIAVYEYALSKKPSLTNKYVLKYLKELVTLFRETHDKLDIIYVRKDLSIMENFSFSFKQKNERTEYVENIYEESSSDEDSSSETDDESFLSSESVESMEFSEEEEEPISDNTMDISG